MPEMTELEVGSKRTMEYEGSESQEDVSASKIAKSVDLPELKLLLLSNTCGGIIGKKGETITRLRNNYQVSIKIESSQTPDRTMKLTGTLENCIGVIKEVLVLSPSAPYPTDQPCAMTIDLLITKDGIDSLAGQSANDLITSSGAQMKIHTDSLPLRPDEHVVAVGGDTEEQVLAAVIDVYCLIMNIPGRSEEVKEFLRKGGHTAMMMKSNAMSAPASKSGIAQPLMDVRWDVPVTVGGGGGGGAAELGVPPSFLQLQTVTNITAPSLIVGAIIGKGGVRIREIRNTSGCKINFSDTEEKDASVERIITLTGTQQQVQMAERMMAQHV